MHPWRNMMSRRMSVFLLCIGILVLLTGIAVCGRGETDTEASRIAIKILILPKFEIGELKGDVPGEAQFYYERYMDGAESYDIPGDSDESPLYVKDGVGLYLVGMGKTMAALNTMALLSDARFDFSNAWILSTGCAGSAKEYGVMGDVFLITAAVDYDLGHHADIREMSDQTSATWFYDAEYDAEAVFRLNPELMDKTYALVKDLPMETTERTRNYMSAAFNGEEWAIRDPRVLRGTTITGDNYWKGSYDHQNALLMAETYHCPDPYTSDSIRGIFTKKELNTTVGNTHNDGDEDHPNIIIIPAWADGTFQTTAPYKDLTAVKEGHVIVLESTDMFDRQCARNADAVEMLAKLIFPECFEEEGQKAA